ncbi:MAG: acyl-CoA thioesterase [Firmicutes bacterium]|nr:acyl-CoA thioesterase [Bacillota bacterium]
MKPYTRRVNYYETDRMQIVHHTNYIRYFEEARMDFMKQIGCDVKTMESMGLIIPNVDAYAKYIVSLKFDDVFRVYVKAAKFTGVRMKFEYEIRFGEKNTLSCEGYTTHCFVNRDYKPVSVKHSHPDIYKKLFEAAKN